MWWLEMEESLSKWIDEEVDGKVDDAFNPKGYFSGFSLMWSWGPKFKSHNHHHTQVDKKPWPKNFVDVMLVSSVYAPCPKCGITENKIKVLMVS